MLAREASAQTFFVPEIVQARPDGTFTLKGKFTAGPEGAVIASDGWFGDLVPGADSINVEGGAFSDCFCPPLFPGCPSTRSRSGCVRSRAPSSTRASPGASR